MREDDELQLKKRLDELAKRASVTGITQFSDFLNPAGQLIAQACAKHADTPFFFWGGWDEAERCMVCFADEHPEADDWPLSSLRITWSHQSAPEHRDLLGSLMALGFDRSRLGDIVLEKDEAWTFCTASLADTIASQWTSAGHTTLKVTVSDTAMQLKAPEGRPVSGTVMSLRLDAVIAEGFGMSRSDAADLVRSGRVRLRHRFCDQVDAKVIESDIISVRGIGRLRLETVGSPTKKGRLPVRFSRYGQ